MRECGKATLRRLHDSQYATRYLVGHGIDVGAGTDPLGVYGDQFPLMRSLRPWDLADGDAQNLPGIAAHQFDFLHSSHCLEHLADPAKALARWCEVVRPAGHLVVLVPDEDLYEQGVWPSTFNNDHKTSFTIGKAASWSPASVNVLDLLQSLVPLAETVRLLRLEGSYHFREAAVRRLDQTLTPDAEAAIEFVLRVR